MLISFLPISQSLKELLTLLHRYKSLDAFNQKTSKTVEMSTYYCNIWLLCNDANLCDLGLLQKVLSLVKSRQCTITASPGRNGDRHCLAIPLEITFAISRPIVGGIADSLFRMSEEKVEQWIQNYRQTGNLSFCRWNLFHSTHSENH